MPTDIKFKPLKSLSSIRDTYPALYNTIINMDLTDETVAGLCLEIAIQSDGTTSVLTGDDDIFLDILEEEDY